MDALSERGTGRTGWLTTLGRSLVVPALAMLTALLTGAVIMLLSGDDPLRAYVGLFEGAFGGARAVSRTIRQATPFILTGLSVAFAFKAGLFNIGASGQFMMGTIASVAVGISLPGLPMVVHLPLAILAGLLGGALWGAIPGALKVWRGAHEVITTIMLNFVASLFAGWTVFAGGGQGQTPGPLSDPQAASRAISQTSPVHASARLPQILPGVLDRVHWGILVAILAAAVVWWLLRKSTLGFEIQTVGHNVHAARYAGMRVGRTMVLTMAIAGALAGLAGTVQTLGLHYRFAPEFTGQAGFEGITVALLGKADPIGVIGAAFLIGAMDAGAPRMQFVSGVSSQLIQVIQALVLMFVAAPEMIRSLYRLRRARAVEESVESPLAARWGEQA